jgi:hypothetical protein
MVLSRAGILLMPYNSFFHAHMWKEMGVLKNLPHPFCFRGKVDPSFRAGAEGSYHLIEGIGHARGDRQVNGLCLNGEDGKDLQK